MVAERAGKVTQLGFPGIRPDIIIPSERLSMGASAPEILAEILKIHPEITVISYVIYDPCADSDDIDQAVVTSERKWISASEYTPAMIRELSESVVEDSSIVYKPRGDEQVVLYNGIALCSEVRLDSRETAHLLMIDFSSHLEIDWIGDENAPEDSTDATSDIDKMVAALGVEKGYILETDNATHFWGVNLLTNEEWVRCMRRLLTNPNIDSGYLYYALENGYSALRLLDYPPVKMTKPKVVLVVR